MSDLVRASPEGPRDTFEDVEELLKAIAAVGAGLEDFQVLVDTRDVTVGPKVSELWLVARTLSRYRGKLGRKTAILCPRERFDHARFYAKCAENEGFNVRAFMSYEDAMEWLLEET